MPYNTPTLTHFTPKSPLKRFSFLSLSPTPRSDSSFARLLESDPVKEHAHTPTIKAHRRAPSLQSPKEFFNSTIKPKNRFALPFTMPSWSLSSKSSMSSTSSAASSYYYTQPSPPPAKKNSRRRYMPVPFFTAVEEYQLLNGGSEKSAIRAILRERGLNMTVDEAIAYFENEDVNGVIRAPPFAHPDVDEYAGLVSRRLSSDGDTSSDDNHVSHSPRTFGLSTLRRRGPPAPLQLNSRSPYGFEDSFVTGSCSPSNASFVSSAASTTLYSPSVVSGKASRSGASMVKGMFHKLSGRK